MKKIIIIMLMFLSLEAFSQVRFTAIQFSSKHDYETKYSPWESVDIPVIMDIDRKHIVIFSQQQQVIDYVAPIPKTQDGYDYITAYATDSNYNTIQIEIWFMSQYTMILRIRYSDYEYQYLLKE